jgi:biopolymer transport protein ExbD
MNVGSGGGSGDGDVIMDINTTPLIDVMLVLLVMLIITIPIQLHSVSLNLPTGNPPPPLVKPEIMKVDIDFAGAIYINGDLVADRAALEERFALEAAKPVQPELHLRPDKKAKYEIVAGVMAAAQRLGLTKIGIVGSEQFVRVAWARGRSAWAPSSPPHGLRATAERPDEAHDRHRLRRGRARARHLGDVHGPRPQRGGDRQEAAFGHDHRGDQGAAAAAAAAEEDRQAQGPAPEARAAAGHSRGGAPTAQ